MKRIFALALAVMLIVAMAVPVMAAETVTLTINHIKPNHTYKAYQIFDGDLTDEGILSNVVWGPGIDGDGLLAALKADTTEITNSAGTETVKFSELFDSAASAADVITIVSGFSTDGDRLQHFAEIASAYVVASEAKTSTGGTVANAAGSYDYTIEGLDPGYYLVVDETTSDLTDDYKTRYILSLTTHTSLVTKGDYSTVEKTVSETLDGTYSEYISAQLNTIHYYKWAVNLDDDLGEYDTYFLQFTDTMSKGLTFLQLEEVYIQEVSNEKVYLYQNGAWVVDADAGVNGTPDVNTVTTDATTGETTVVLAWNDLKSAYTAVAGDDTLVVKYSAKLNEDAVYGVDGNPNEVYIKYSNGPDDEDFGESVPDDAIVFSFQLNVVKVNADDNTILLPGAEFMLYHLHGTEKHYAVVDENGLAIDWTTNTPASIAAEIKAVEDDTTLTDEEKAAKIAEIEAKPVASVLVTDANGNIKVSGLDGDILYYLTETKAPAGYNLMFTDVQFSIHPNYVTDANGELTYDTLTYRVDGKDYTLTEGEDFTHGIVTATVVNDKGDTLPSTGGMGTTLFYVIGGTMVAAALVLLITKKRMAA